MDEADRAALDSEAYEASLAQRFSGSPYQTPPGVPGECDKCGEESGRLIDGLCARCRDGRRPR